MASQTYQTIHGVSDISDHKWRLRRIRPYMASQTYQTINGVSDMMALLHVTECEGKQAERNETNSSEQSSQLVKKFPASYGTRRFITALVRARHLSL